MVKTFILDGNPVTENPYPDYPDYGTPADYNGHDDKKPRTFKEDRFKQGWDPRALVTIEDCNEARDELMSQISSIEAQLGDAEDHQRETGEYADALWYRSAKTALKYKRIGLQKVQERRAEIGRDVRAKRTQTKVTDLIGLLKEIDRNAFERLMREAEIRGIY